MRSPNYIEGSTLVPKNYKTAEEDRGGWSHWVGSEAGREIEESMDKIGFLFVHVQTHVNLLKIGWKNENPKRTSCATTNRV